MYYTRINKSQEIFLPKLLCVFLYKSLSIIRAQVLQHILLLLVSFTVTCMVRKKKVMRRSTINAQAPNKRSYLKNFYNAMAKYFGELFDY